MKLMKSKDNKDTRIDGKECGVMKTVRIIGSKWTMLILRDLLEGTKRFGELQKSLSGISPRTLSLRLQQLEEDGIVTRKVFTDIPLKVEYSLTKKGLSLGQIISDMRFWGEAI